MTEKKEQTKGSSRRDLLGSVAAGLLAPQFMSAAGPQEQPEHPGYSKLETSRAASNVLIGNFQALMPGGIAFIKNHETGILLDVGWDKTGRPGCSAPDFSYNRTQFEVDGAAVTFEWGRVGSEAAVVRLTSDRNVKLLMKLPSNSWRPFYQYFNGNEKGLDCLAVSMEGHYYPWNLRVDPAPNVVTPLMSAQASVEVQVWPERPVRVAAGFGTLPRLSSVDDLLNEAGRRYQARRAQASGDWGDFAGAIADNLNNSRLYSSLTKRVVNVIGRSGWLMSDPDYLPLFTWDTSFNALLASIEDPETAKETARTVLRYQLPNGMLPQLSDWPGEGKAFGGFSCSNPPVTSLCIWKLYQRWQDRDFLQEVYPRLLRWHDWWPKHSDGNQNGLLEWGATVGGWKQALLATGWDDTPHFDGSGYAGTQMTADAVDLNSLWSLDAETLSKMAAVLGLRQDEERLQREHREMNRLINDRLWNEEVGMYCSRLWDEDGKPGRYLTRLTPQNFYPLICGAPDEERAKRVLATLTDPKKFWGRWLLPTLAYNDPEYGKQEYWKGHIWGPANYIVWQGVRRYCSPEQQVEFAKRSVELFMKSWKAWGTCNENYKSTDGTGDDHPHYTWGALLCQIGIELIYDVGADGLPIPLKNNSLSDTVTLRNVPAGGKLYHISSKAGDVTVRPA